MKTAKRETMPIFAAAVHKAVAENRKLGIRFEYMDKGERVVEAGTDVNGTLLLKSGSRHSNKSKLKVG